MLGFLLEHWLRAADSVTLMPVASPLWVALVKKVRVVTDVHACLVSRYW